MLRSGHCIRPVPCKHRFVIKPCAPSLLEATQYQAVTLKWAIFEYNIDILATWDRMPFTESSQNFITQKYCRYNYRPLTLSAHTCTLHNLCSRKHLIAGLCKFFFFFLSREINLGAFKLLTCKYLTYTDSEWLLIAQASAMYQCTISISLRIITPRGRGEVNWAVHLSRKSLCNDTQSCQLVCVSGALVGHVYGYTGCLLTLFVVLALLVVMSVCVCVCVCVCVVFTVLLVPDSKMALQMAASVLCASVC